MLVAAIAVFTWVRTRADGIHAFDAWPLTAVVLSILLAARADGRRLRLDAIAGITGILMLSVGAGGLALRDMMGPSRGPVRGAVGIAGERSWMSGTELASLIQAIDQAVPPGHAIWVGLQRNDLVTFNDTMLYVLANRPPGTVYFEALPGLTNALPIEQTIACQLTAAGVTLLVLGPSSAGEPSNLSSVPGSTYLDQWIAAHTESRATLGGYSLITLRPDRSQAGGCLSSDAAARALGLPAVP
jgi:hypothetical protein